MVHSFMNLLAVICKLERLHFSAGSALSAWKVSLKGWQPGCRSPAPAGGGAATKDHSFMNLLAVLCQLERLHFRAGSTLPAGKVSL